ncbi:MAG: hypothetical protein ABI340_09840 [Nitrososphaera sp.]|jgi:hypothetical protein
MKSKGLPARRGLASIVTNAILLVSVVLMGTGAVVWENDKLSAGKLELLNVYSTKIDKINENLSIEKIWFGTTPQKFINITMTNQSPLSIVVKQVQISTSSGTVTFPVNNQIIMSEKSASLKLNYNYISNISNTVEITTSRNSTFSTVVSTP